MQPAKVLIVGSGPAGLIVALSLLKNGIPVRIIEKDAQHHRGERGPGVMPRTLEIEHFLGVANDVREAGNSSWTLHFLDPKEPYRIIRSSKMIEDVQPTPTFPIAHGVSLGQWHHQAILRRHIEALGGEVELGSAFVGYIQDENGVTAEIRKMVDGVERTEKATFEYVVGADGGRSTMRKAMGVNFLGETREEGKLHILDAYMQGMGGDKDVYVWGSYNIAMAVVRHSVESGLFQVIFSGPEVNFDALKTPNDEKSIQEELNRVTGRTDILITDITWHGEWRPNIRMVDRFSVGRAFIIGDAAHTHSPAGGQGLNSSVQDAFNLAWKLSLSIKGYASSALLESFEAERLPVIAEMLKLTTDLFNLHIKSSNCPSKSVSDAAKCQSQEAPNGEGEAWHRGRNLFQLDIHYRWSPVVVDERFSENKSAPADVYGTAGHDTRAGDRAPDAPALIGDAATSRLFDIFNPTMHTMLLFMTNGSAIEKAQAILSPFGRLPAGLTQSVLVLPPGAQSVEFSSIGIMSAVVDSEGHAYGGYGVNTHDESPTVVVVRPDAMIGAFLKTEAGAQEYLTAVFKMDKLECPGLL